MVVFAQHSSAPTRRAKAIPAVAPIARAVRAALAVSATVLAFSAPAMAHADGACGLAAAAFSTYACSDIAAQIEGSAVAPYDLTRVSDDGWPVSVSSRSRTENAIETASGDQDGAGSMPFDALPVSWPVDDISVVGDDPSASPQVFSPAAQAGTFAAVDSAVFAYGTDVAINYGLVEATESFTYLTNYDAVNASADAEDGDAFVMGVLAQGWDAATLHNYAGITARASSDTADAQAYAAVADGAHNSGIAVLINGGDLVAEATAAGAGGLAYATGAYAIGNVASIFNDLDSTATAIAGEGGSATARAARAYGSYTAIYSYGDLTASASADSGEAMARGADSFGYNGSTVYNAGNIHSSASGDVSSATGVYSVGYTFSAYTTNTGDILAEAHGESASAYGALNVSAYLGDAITVNQGTISAVAEGGMATYGEEEAVAFGVYNLAAIYTSLIDNSGTITATALAQEDISGTDYFLQAKSVGVIAVNSLGYWDAGIVNSGEIGAISKTSQGYASAWGVAVQSSGAYGGAVSIDNTGSIWAYGHADVGIAYATGAYAFNLMGAAEIANHGDITASARVETGRGAGTYGYGVLNYVYATGAKALSLYGGDANVANYGNIEAHASALGAITGARGIQASGLYSSVVNAAGASITTIGEVDLWGAGRATGIEASGVYGVDVTNDGTIVAYGHSHGYSYGVYETHYSVAQTTGIYAGAGFQGDVSVVNNGDITATSIAEDSITFFNGGAGAVGIDTYAKYDATVVNAGDINVTADSELGIVTAYGVVGHGKYSTNIVNDADASIVALASVDSLYSDAYGGRAFSAGTRVFGRGMQQGVVYNAGSIVSHATVTADGGPNAGRSIATAYGASVGAYSAILNGSVVNMGDIEAAASADFGYATAYGSFVLAQYRSETSNAGAITAAASAANGDAWAVGSYAFALHQTVSYNCGYQDGPYGQYYTCDYSNPIRVTDGGESAIDNSGSIIAMASAEGGMGHGYGVVAIGALEAGITNTGHISVVSDADGAHAIGALANSFYGDTSLMNSGDILAVATGPIANATGASLLAETGVQADNSGTIVAAAYGDDATAIAVSMQSYGSNVLTNTGTIAALGDGTRIAISSNADATANIVNRGSLSGAVVTGDLDDSFENAAGATWRAVGESDFGAGNNTFANAGTIIMDDATIGGHADAAIAAFAAIQPASHVSGSVFDNTGTLVVSGANNTIDTGTFANDGIISFVDGAPDDVLAIVGDFSGDGVINLDVSGLNQASDRLYVDGSIIEPTTQTLNVNLVDLPTAPSIDVPLIATSGTLAGDFVLGNTQFTLDGFVTMDFGLNVSDDSVSLGVDVTGLNATGELAADIAPGVQSLVNAQAGTYRQRMGVVPEAGKVGLAPWMRMFTDSGDVDARYAGNFGAGGLGFHQSNHGWEVGLDTRPSEHVAFGAFIGKSDGSQGLEGAGSNRLDGSTFGLYGTWFGGHGAYVDVSHRWTGVDARLRSAMGTHTTKASAQSFNVEGGFTAWTSAGGLNVVPQLQYTRTRISDIRTLHASQAEFVNEGGMSSRGRLGVALDRSFQGGSFTLTPYGSFNVVREFDGDFDHAVNGGIQGTTSTDGTSAMVELGLGARKGGLSISGGANWMDGGAVDSVTGAQLTVRYSW